MSEACKVQIIFLEEYLTVFLVYCSAIKLRLSIIAVAKLNIYIKIQMLLGRDNSDNIFMII